MTARMLGRLQAKPLTRERWGDFESIFGARGCSVARVCWCMYYRLSGCEADPPAGCTRAAANRKRMKALVDAGRFTGLIGYRDRTPVGWVSFGPREEFRKLARSPVMKPVDAQPVWSIICFVVPAEFRDQGMAHALLRAAVAYAKKHGAKIVEAYPVDRKTRAADDSMWFGSKSMYDAAGFDEVARRRPARPIVRLQLARS